MFKKNKMTTVPIRMPKDANTVPIRMPKNANTMPIRMPTDPGSTIETKNKMNDSTEKCAGIITTVRHSLHMDVEQVYAYRPCLQLISTLYLYHKLFKLIV